MSRTEHVIVDRVVPLLLVVVLPLLGAIYIAQERNADARRVEQIEACKRGNRVRHIQEETLSYLIDISERASFLAASPERRDFYADAIPGLRVLRAQSFPVDCEEVVG